MTNILPTSNPTTGTSPQSKAGLRSSQGTTRLTKRALPVENYPPGYPRYAALISSDSSFNVCRRFLRLRARLLLYKQDNIVQLEKELDKLDREEPRLLFLGNYRRDRNNERAKVVEQIGVELAKYDALLKQNREALSMEGAKPRDVDNLRNWVRNTSCIARDEIKYLDEKQDLMNLDTTLVDGASHRIRNALEDLFTWSSKRVPDRLKKIVKLKLRLSISKDPRIFILSTQLVNGIGQLIMASLIGLIIVVPAIVVNAVRLPTTRFIVIFLATAFFILFVSLVTRAKTVEVCIAGATYAAVLVVFIGESTK